MANLGCWESSPLLSIRSSSVCPPASKITRELLSWFGTHQFWGTEPPCACWRGTVAMERVSGVVGFWPGRFFSGLRFITYNFTIPEVGDSENLVFCSPSACGCVNIWMWIVLKPKPILYGKSLFLCCFLFQMTVEQDNVSLECSWLRKNSQGISQWNSNSL